MEQIDMTGLTTQQINGLESLTGRKSSEDYLNVIANFLRIEQKNPQEAMVYFISESMKRPNFDRNFFGACFVDNSLCFSPQTNRFYLIDPQNLSLDFDLNKRDFNVFLVNGATSNWGGYQHLMDGFTSVSANKLSTIEKPDKFFPSYPCIDDKIDKQLRLLYRFPDKGEKISLGFSSSRIRK